MKKSKIHVILIVLVLAIIFMVGCSQSQKLKKELNGTWRYTVISIDGPCYMIYTFNNNNTFKREWINVNVPSKTSYVSGTYEIMDSEIILTNSDGKTETIIKYTFEDDNLILIDLGIYGSKSRELVKE